MDNSRHRRWWKTSDFKILRAITPELKYSSKLEAEHCSAYLNRPSEKGILNLKTRKYYKKEIKYARVGCYGNGAFR
jgi:hypothetical protein